MLTIYKLSYEELDWVIKQMNCRNEQIMHIIFDNNKQKYIIIGKKIEGGLS